MPGNQGTVMDITTSIAGIKLKHPVFNAAGPICTTKEELDAIGASAASAIVCKTMTKEPRKGNPEPRYADFGRNSINSMGLPNPGYKAYMALLPSSSSMRSRRLYLATRSERQGAPAFICPVFMATARSLIVVSSVSPDL